MDDRIKQLAKKRVYLGTSSWKYGGWHGLVYQKTYENEKAFNEQCLTEYADTFPAVGVDHTYYAWPSATTFQKYVEQTPEGFQFALKATERTTIFQYPTLKRYGKYAGLKNETFLNAEEFAKNFLEPLKPHRDRLCPIMFEFSQFYPGSVGSGAEFVALLDGFFRALAPLAEGFRFAVEMRNQNWLKKPYFEALVSHNVAHVFNSWTRMPSIGEQLALAEGFRLPALMARVLLEPGVKYEAAVEAFSPYDRVQAEHPKIRDDVAELIRRALAQGLPAYVFVNNRCEGCAPKTIEGILERLKNLAD